MSDTIFAAVIAGGAAIIAAIVAGLISRNRKLVKAQKSVKLKNGGDIPKPFPCADICTEDYIQLYGESKVEFDFIAASRPGEIPAYVSLVYQFQNPEDVSKFKNIEFSIRFGEGEFNKLWLEVHPFNQDKFSIKRIPIMRKKGWQDRKVTYSELDLSDMRYEIKEICFVVNKNHFSQKARENKSMRGSFEVKDLRFSK